MNAGPILIVEDDADFREALAALVDDVGYPVLTASDGEAALQVLGSAQQPPALILADLNMPGMNGATLITRLRHSARWATVPVVVMSADLDAEQASDALGAVACLRKPIDVEELLALVQHWSQSDQPSPLKVPP